MPYSFQDLSDNKLGNGCAAFISQIMHQNVTLTHITISGKSIVIEKKTSNLSKLEVNLYNPLHSDGFSHTDKSYKDGIVHCIF